MNKLGLCQFVANTQHPSLSAQTAVATEKMFANKNLGRPTVLH